LVAFLLIYSTDVNRKRKKWFAIICTLAKNPYCCY
jgi:hypothetical protein